MKTEYKLPGDRVLVIEQDLNAESPREMCDHLGTMVCFHRRYNLGDPRKHSYQSNDFDDLGHLLKTIMREHKPLAILPLYLYDHGGITISTADFNDRWDSGMIGFIFVQKKDKENLWGKHRLTKKKALEVLKAEVAEYDDYLRGNVYGFRIMKVEKCNLGHEHRTELDSCWGFYGYDHEKSGLLSEALDADDRAAVLAQIKGVAA